ncbi:MAG: hypothetical protein ACREDH_01410 [Methylocella sp.]
MQVTNVIIEADKAKQEGRIEVAEQKAAEAKATIDASASTAHDLGKLAEAANKASHAPAPGAEQYFFDDFKGKAPADH